MKSLSLIIQVAAVASIAGQACLAQTMQFSIYHNSWVGNDGSLYYDSSTVDQSSCTSHSNYGVTATIYSPTGRQASSTTSGLYSSTVSLPLNDDVGEYRLSTSGTYYCGCSFMNAGFGGGLSLYTYKTSYTSFTSEPSTGCGGQPCKICYYETKCLVGKNPPTCKPGGYQFSVGADTACPDLKVYFNATCTDIFVSPITSGYQGDYSCT